MKKLLLILILSLPFIFLFGQDDNSDIEKLLEGDMDNNKLGLIIKTLSDEMEGHDGNWRFLIDSTLFICLTDENHNRMRIISPIVEADNVSVDQMEKCMEANFHTSLDSKYASSDGILFAVFIHPLAELTLEQVISAISQVYSSANTFGTSYSSGLLSFPKSEEAKKMEKKIVKKI